MSDKSVLPEAKFSKLVVFENVMINIFRVMATQKGLASIDRLPDKHPGRFTLL
jgi:hypothetical protein